MTRTRLGFAIFVLVVPGVAALRAATWQLYSPPSRTFMQVFWVSWPGWVNPVALVAGLLGIGLAMALVVADRR